MADKFKKIDKDFTLGDSTVNVYGFRLLTAGYLKDEYAKNPIGYLMHERKDGVVVKWDDLRVEGDAILGKPCINLSNAKGQQIVDEVESGFLNAASLGHFVVLETSDDPALKLPGQTGPTVTKWYNRECSLVDIPGNYNSLKLFDKDDNEINLADFTTNFKMKQIILTAEQLGKLNLKAEADSAAFETALNSLVAEAAKVPQLVQDLAAANTSKKTAEDALTALKAATVATEVKNLVDGAVAAGKLTKEAGETLAVDYATNPAGLKNLVAKIPVYKSITSVIEQEAGNIELKDLMAKSYGELDKVGKLERLKALDEEAFKTKFKAQFGTDYGK